jgi:hypothetical protein
MDDSYSDTSPEAMRVWLELRRRMPNGEKLAGVFELIDFARQMAATGVRMRYPQADEREVFLRVAALHLTREEMIRVYGWDPEEH